MELEHLRYYPTKGGLVVGKSKRAEHPNLQKMPDFRPEEDLDFLPILQTKQTSTKGSQGESSQDGSQASTTVDLSQLLDDEDLFASTYTASGVINDATIPNEDQDSEVEAEEPLQEPDIDDDEEINITSQIQGTLASTLEFKEFVEHTQNIEGDHKLSENLEFVEKLYIGQQWLNKVQCRDYLKGLALDMNYCMVQMKNKEKIQSYKCKDTTCEWFVYCSVLSDGQTFECKKGHFTHTCESYHGLKHPLANARWVAKVMLECYKAHPKYKPSDFISEVKKNHKVDISYYTAWHAFHLCNEKLLGSYEEGYSLLPALCDQILKENARNIASLRTDPSNGKFQSLCISYRASLDGFVESGRPLLGLDGCHLLGKYGGTLLAITSLDGHNRATCKGPSAENLDKAPATYTGPHVRPNPSTRPPPPPPTPFVPPSSTAAAQSSADGTNPLVQEWTSTAPSTTTQRNGPRTRGGTSKRRGGRTSTAPSPPTPLVPPTDGTNASTTTQRNGPRTRGGTSKRRGGRTATAPSPPTPLVPRTRSVTSKRRVGDVIKPSSAAAEPFVPSTRGGRGRGSTSGQGRGGQGRGSIEEATTSTRVAFGTTVSTRGRGGQGSRGGKGSRAYARGQTVHRRNGEIVGMGILQPEGPRLPREPTLARQPVQAVNPRPPTGRGTGLVSRGGGMFSSSSGRGKRKFMDWFGTPEQWADEN